MRGWILSVTVSAMLIAVAEGMMPSGSVKKAARLLGGLVLMLGILQPIVRLDIDTLFRAANAQSALRVETRVALEEESDEMMKSIIEAELCAYVLDKAQDLGIACAVSIVCTQGENRALLPYSAEIRGLLIGGQQASLARILREDLDIPTERQAFYHEDIR